MILKSNHENYCQFKNNELKILINLSIHKDMSVKDLNKAPDYLSYHINQNLMKNLRKINQIKTINQGNN